MKNTFCNGRYEEIPSNFLGGRSGIPGLARDIQTGDIVFTKSTDLSSPQYKEQYRCLINEAMVLRELAGLGVPTLLDFCRETRQIEDESKEFLSLIMENIGDAENVGEIYTTLSFIERIEILMQFFNCLTNAHTKRIINGDIDIKHLYWRREKLQLIVIDWGNARNATKYDDYMIDLQKSGEVVYSLLTLRPFPISGEISLQQLPPDTPEIFQKLLKLSWQKDSAPMMSLSVIDLSRAVKEWKKKLVNELLSQADDKFLSGEYDKSLKIYQDVLRWDARNSRAQVQLLKAKYINAENTGSEIPIEARRLYNIARSALAARDLNYACETLKRAIEIAQSEGVEFVAAKMLYEQIQVKLQNALMAEKYWDNALVELEKQEWTKALNMLESAMSLDPSDGRSGLLHSHLRDLLKARSLVEQVQTGIGDKSSRSKRIQEIEGIIEKTRDSVYLNALWRNVVQMFQEVNWHAIEAKQVNSVPLKQNIILIKSILWACLISVAIIITTFGFIYLFPKQAIELDCSRATPNLLANVAFPSYLANGDEGEIQVTLANAINASAPITGSVIVDFQGPANVRLAAKPNSNIISFKSLLPGEKKSESIKFFFDEPTRLFSNPSRYINFSLRVLGNNQQCLPANLHIAMSPIYGMRTVFTLAWSSIGIGVIGLLWNSIRKKLGLN